MENKYYHFVSYIFNILVACFCLFLHYTTIINFKTGFNFPDAIVYSIHQISIAITLFYNISYIIGNRLTKDISAIISASVVNVLEHTAKKLKPKTKQE